MNIKKTYTLSLLLFVILVPAITAYLFYFNPKWLNYGKYRGEILPTPVLLQDLHRTAQWRLVLWVPGQCEELCQQQLLALARVHHAADRFLYDVVIVVLQSDSAPPLATYDVKTLEKLGLIYQRSSITARDIINRYEQSEMFIVNRQNYAILRFNQQASARDIYHDLRQLITSNEV